MLTFTKRSLIVSIIYSWGFRITNLFVVTCFPWERKKRGRGYQCCEKLFGNKTNFFPLFQGTHTFNMKKNNLFTIIFSIEMILSISGESGRRVRSGPQGRLLAHRPTGGGSTTCCKSTHPSDTTFAPVDLLKRMLNKVVILIAFYLQYWSSWLWPPLWIERQIITKKTIWRVLISVIHNHSQKMMPPKTFQSWDVLCWTESRRRCGRGGCDQSVHQRDSPGFNLKLKLKKNCNGKNLFWKFL